MFLKIKFNKYDLRAIGRKGLIQQIENMFHVQQARRSFQKILSTLLGHTDSFIKFRLAIIEILFYGCQAIKQHFKGKHTKNNSVSVENMPYIFNWLHIHYPPFFIPFYSSLSSRDFTAQTYTLLVNTTSQSTWHSRGQPCHIITPPFLHNPVPAPSEIILIYVCPLVLHLGP